MAWTILRWALILAVAFLFLLLSVANWTLVPFLLPQGRAVQVPLPLIISGAFVAGWLPTWLSHLAARTVWKRRIERAERAAMTDSPSATAPEGAPEAGAAYPSQAQPIIVPPAGA